MIITTIDQVKAVITNITAEMEFSEFQPYTESAEHWLQEEITGETIYTGIDDGSITDEKLLRLVKNVIVLKAYETAIPFMDLVQTSSGFGVVSDKNRAPASQHRIDRLVAQNKLRLDRETEWLFNYLEDNSTYHDDWKSSPAYSILTDCLIRTAREFKRLAKFEGDRSEFLLMKPALIALTLKKIHPTISKAYTNELIAKQNAGTLTAEDNAILTGVKQALANYAINNDHLGDRLIGDVLNVMDADLESYPTYGNSDEKAVRDDPGFVNAEDNPMFVFKGGI